ncbi:coiled-coil domain-containing protein 82 isoform X2 [Poecile atricapillus]|nr:coiled-coil domain-containing protein 82 isoform X2 [Poecile atricapillus]XP_058700800.1 coiled-coil domain-containing protein 82 isoform X2 [Poecile atricapillus]XP_058700811.1 coiled-coil domain-containing protein 82 isoform X2 [Poecile atricapillus]XP_058700820.1 coiled-coil domain-containing protein 82 isoform X2 [Poecile atricapillus]
MGVKPVVKRYETRNKTEVPSSKSRVDWRRTRRALILLDSNDESSATSEEESTTSESEIDEKGQAAVKNNLSDQEENNLSDRSGEVTKDGDDECVVPGKRNRLSASVMYDSDESEGSDILVRKVSAKRRCILDDDESSKEQHPDKTGPTENVSTSKKQKVLEKLKELVKQSAARRSCRTENCEDSNSEEAIEEEPLHQLPLIPSEGSETDGDSLKDFVVEEDSDDDDIGNPEHVKSQNQPHQKQPNPSNSELLAHYIPQLSRCDHYVHFKRIVKAFLINAIDDTFLSSLYDGTRQKKYAQDMLLSLHYLDDRFIQPRLENLICRSRWKDRYKERVDCYPDVRISLKNTKNMSCQACELKRCCRFNVLLSGRLYNSKTMEVDDFMSNDKQVLKVGIVCANRTRVYHNLKHFKYKLYMDCSSVAGLDGVEDEPVKDTVERLLNHLEESGWIQKKYDGLEDYMEDADNFQEEKID